MQQEGVNKPVYRKEDVAKVKLICFRKPNFGGVAKVSKLESQRLGFCRFAMKLPGCWQNTVLWGFWLTDSLFYSFVSGK
jgi:hypothetical protein